MYLTGYRSAAAIFWAQWRTLREHIHLPRGQVSARGVTSSDWPSAQRAAQPHARRSLCTRSYLGARLYVVGRSRAPLVRPVGRRRLRVLPRLQQRRRRACFAHRPARRVTADVSPFTGRWCRCCSSPPDPRSDVRKLRAYPIPENQLFSIEILLRVTSAVEMLLLLGGMLLGALCNPALPAWSALAALFAVFNLILAVGLRDLLARLLARRRIREIVVLLMVLAAVLPQLLLARRGMVQAASGRLLFIRDAWLGWPWTVAANLLTGSRFWVSLAVLSAWILAAYVFSSWQFGRTLRFDADAAGSGSCPCVARRRLARTFHYAGFIAGLPGCCAIPWAHWSKRSCGRSPAPRASVWCI